MTPPPSTYLYDIQLAGELIGKNRQLEAVELFRNANKPTEAALLIGDIAEVMARKEVKPSLAKKLHVLAALEVHTHSHTFTHIQGTFRLHDC